MHYAVPITNTCDFLRKQTYKTILAKNTIYISGRLFLWYKNICTLIVSEKHSLTAKLLDPKVQYRVGCSETVYRKFPCKFSDILTLLIIRMPTAVSHKTWNSAPSVPKNFIKIQKNQIQNIFISWRFCYSTLCNKNFTKYYRS